ncbi:MAG: hypothetical protein ACOYN0_09840 [Phycisphaerales bacterium]
MTGSVVATVTPALWLVLTAPAAAVVTGTPASPIVAPSATASIATPITASIARLPALIARVLLRLHVLLRRVLRWSSGALRLTVDRAIAPAPAPTTATPLALPAFARSSFALTAAIRGTRIRPAALVVLRLGVVGVLAVFGFHRVFFGRDRSQSPFRRGSLVVSVIARDDPACIGSQTTARGLGPIRFDRELVRGDFLGRR